MYIYMYTADSLILIGKLGVHYRTDLFVQNSLKKLHLLHQDEKGEIIVNNNLDSKISGAGSASEEKHISECRIKGWKELVCDTAGPLCDL